MNGIEKSTNDSILIEKEFACCRCAAQSYSVLDFMYVLCECDDEIMKKFLVIVTKDAIISTWKILTSHFSNKSLFLRNYINARTNLGITCKQNVLKQNLFAALENFERLFHFSLSSKVRKYELKLKTLQNQIHAISLRVCQELVV